MPEKVIPFKFLWFGENIAPELANIGQLFKFQSYSIVAVLVAVVRRTENSFHWINYNTRDKSIDFDETIELIVAGINMFWAQLGLILARAVRRGLKWALERTQNIFMAKNIYCATIITTTLEGIEN